MSCGVIDPREVFEDEDEAAAASDWTCLECGATRFEVGVMPDPEPTTEADIEE